jgi:hypothetical protein
MVMSEPRTYSNNHVARILDRSRAWVYDQQKKGLLKYKIGLDGRRRTADEELRRFIDAGCNER